MTTLADSGIVHLASRHPASTVLEILLAFLHTKGVTVFTVIDHSGEAAKAGLTMPNTKVVVFGSPRTGTPLMLAVPEIALDLPLKLLIAEQPDGTSIISYSGVAFLQARYKLSSDAAAPLSVIEQIAAAIAQ